MTSDRSLFATYDEWSGGAAQVGDGDKLRAVGRGRLKPIIVRNHSTGTPVTLRVQQYAWHVPTLVFDILSIPMLQKDRIQVNLGAFNERTAIASTKPVFPQTHIRGLQGTRIWKQLLVKMWLWAIRFTKNEHKYKNMHFQKQFQKHAFSDGSPSDS